MNEKIEKAAEILQSGGIVLLPTDTVFGICCRIDKKESLERLFAIKKRDKSQAVPILVSSTDMVKEYVLPFEEKVEKLMEDYWPGGLTIVLKANTEKVLPEVRGNGDTLGVRIPDLLPTFQIIEKLGIPIVGTSANFHGKPSVTKWKDLDPELVKLVDYVLEVDSLGGVASTVVDCSESPWKILRQGAVRFENMKTLFIDTTSNKEIIVRLTIDEKEYVEKREIQNNRTQIVLPLVQELLKTHNLVPQDLEKIEINPGPGSFTGVRVGAAIANALIFSLKIPQYLIEPKYS